MAATWEQLAQLAQLCQVKGGVLMVPPTGPWGLESLFSVSSGRLPFSLALGGPQLHLPW